MAEEEEDEEAVRVDTPVVPVEEPLELVSLAPEVVIELSDDDEAKEPFPAAIVTSPATPVTDTPGCLRPVSPSPSTSSGPLLLVSLAVLTQAATRSSRESSTLS
jgi:hypothetical protein